MKKIIKILLGTIILSSSISSFAAPSYDKAALQSAYKECKSNISKNSSEQQANKQFADCMNSKGFHLNN